MSDGPGDRTRRRDDVTDVELVGGVEQRELYLLDHDPAWADQYAAHEARIRAALDDRAVAIEHIGSTSVPGLAAKPIIDVLVTVPDITAEEDYLEPLLAAGYLLRVREPGHRLVRTEQRDVHVHLLEPDDVAAHDYLLLRDHLRRDPDDRDLYEATKRELMTREWADMNAYADAKTTVIEAIKSRARSHPGGRRP
ncbi:GrpB family protein [Nocardioides plantarum]|uniref:GrpB family protein n=1 Tax=Nocardioides plantarum TaxID=29299 RepID=A0ABV5KHK2_9ACTN|nr:GrpB family protein [Nocardioides plantarum]